LGEKRVGLKPGGAEGRRRGSSRPSLVGAWPEGRGWPAWTLSFSQSRGAGV